MFVKKISAAVQDFWCVVEMEGHSRKKVAARVVVPSIPFAKGTTGCFQPQQVSKFLKRAQCLQN